MEFLRVSENPWGQTLVLGASWDLLGWFVGAALLFIAAHGAYMYLRAPSGERQ